MVRVVLLDLASEIMEHNDCHRSSDKPRIITKAVEASSAGSLKTNKEDMSMGSSAVPSSWQVQKLLVGG